MCASFLQASRQVVYEEDVFREGEEFMALDNSTRVVSANAYGTRTPGPCEGWVVERNLEPEQVTARIQGRSLTDSGSISQVSAAQQLTSDRLENENNRNCRNKPQAVDHFNTQRQFEAQTVGK